MSAVLGIVGGLGLFLFGMGVLTDSLKVLAGGALKRALKRFTHSPVSGVLTGAGLTALVQSSSATTVAAVGFTGAGLLTFTEALGILFGANIGTTITGWLVALVGFKLKIGDLALFLVFLGAAVRLLTKGRSRAVGQALAGFGLVFVGLGFLQEALAGAQGVVTPDSFPPDTFLGRGLLVLIGVVITLVTQSSSAGVAAAMTALYSGNIEFAQAAAMVVGMDVGTTVTAALAAVGGSTAARRTGTAHVVYNVLTGVAAFLLVPVYAGGIARFAPGLLASSPEIALVSFHTFFNTLGVVAVMPFVGAFAGLIERLVPDRSLRNDPRLEEGLLENPTVALEAVLARLRQLAADSAGELASWLRDGQIRDDLSDEALALEATRGYLARMRTHGEEQTPFRTHVACLHAIDHLEGLLAYAGRRPEHRTVAADEALAGLAGELEEGLGGLAAALRGSPGDIHELLEIQGELPRSVEPYRHENVERAVRGQAGVDETLERLDAMHWLERVGYFGSRLAFYLAEEV